MNLGVWLPVVSSHPRYAASVWERDAGPAELAMVAKAADRLGYDCICAPEHVAVPAGRREGTLYWDPLSTLGYIAAYTRRVRLAPLVLVLGYHHPLEIVKRYGTLDRLSGGRVVLGLGVGGTEGEFELLGASFADRGARADDNLAAIRASLGTTTPRYQGRFFSFSGVIVEPTLPAATPLWIGGGSRHALRRALRSAHGWAPTGLHPAELGALLAELDPGRQRAGDFEIVFLPRSEHKVDPLGDPEAVRSFLDEIGQAGATTLLPRMPSRSVTHYVDQMAALRDLADGPR